VRIGLTKSEDHGLHLTFEHPTQPGNLTGGWMVKTPEQAPVQANLNAKAAPALKPTRQIKLSEVRKHQKEDSCWIIVRNKVYDCTPFLDDHPGGADSILINGGVDATEEFDAIHSAKAQAMLEEYYIGDLVASKDDIDDISPNDKGQGDSVQVVSAAGKLVALNPRERIPLPLIEREVLSHDVRRYVCVLYHSPTMFSRFRMMFSANYNHFSTC
jgi:nitrate reductase (NAD(P)H)